MSEVGLNTGSIGAMTGSSASYKMPTKLAEKDEKTSSRTDFSSIRHNPDATAKKMRGIIDNATSKGLLSVQDYATARRAQGAYIQAQAQKVWQRVDTVQSAFSNNPINKSLAGSSRIATKAPFEEAATKYRAAHQLVKQPIDIQRGSGLREGLV
jgi:hypothetical protein